MASTLLNRYGYCDQTDAMYAITQTYLLLDMGYI